MCEQIRKKFVNKPGNAVDDALRGVVAADSLVQFHPKNPRVIIRKDIRSDETVTLVAGGGSGHEPFASGYVGDNAITAAICGDLFASPPSMTISDGVEAIYGNAGTLIFVINYTGDRLHFGMAAERLKASRSKAKIDLVYVDDDVALEGKAGGTIGGRGLAGAAFVLHIAGVLAEMERADFNAVRDTARCVIDNIGTFGVSLYACALPGKSYMFELGDDEMELGLGIHGESGCERRKLVGAKELIDSALIKLVDSRRLSLKKGDRICVLLNNLGGVSQLELGILKGEALTWLVSRGYDVALFASGSLMTSVDGHGISLTILKVKDDKWIKLLVNDSAIARHWTMTRPATRVVEPPSATDSGARQRGTVEDITPGVKVEKAVAEATKACVLAASRTIAEHADLLDKLDSSCGDGDCGASLKSASEVIEAAVKKGELDFSRPKLLALKLSQLFEDSIGGTSGALYALLFGSAASSFEKSFTETDCKKALEQGLKSIMYYGHAKPGYRTLVDPLDAAVKKKEEDWSAIVEAVEKTAEKTAKMEAKSGRASYTSAEQQRQPDPGAKAVALWFRAAYNAYAKQ